MVMVEKAMQSTDPIVNWNLQVMMMYKYLYVFTVYTLYFHNEEPITELMNLIGMGLFNEVLVLEKYFDILSSPL